MAGRASLDPRGSKDIFPASFAAGSRGPGPVSTELFPIPVPSFVDKSSGSSRKARQRSTRRSEVWGLAVETIRALNALYNCDPSLRPAQSLEPAHASVHSHIFETLSAVKPDHALPDPRAAFDELLSKVRASYEGGGSTVESFDPARVSLPPLARPPVQLGAV